MEQVSLESISFPEKLIIMGDNIVSEIYLEIKKDMIGFLFPVTNLLEAALTYLNI